jgi:hypothetical protein
LGSEIRADILRFETATGKTVKSIQLIRLDQPGFISGSKTNLVDVEVTIRQ